MKQLPEKLELRAINKIVPIEYRAIHASKKLILQNKNDSIFFFGNVKLKKECVTLLINWLKKQAKHYLPMILEKISTEIGLSYRRVGVRDQKTLWGSCSSNHDIQLNYRLILFPEAFARYIMVHELCHTVHLNHSPQFWGLLQQFVPNYKEIVKQLRTNTLLPGWL